MKAIYPGSFDPVTTGHLDIIERAASIFDEVVVAVSVNREKKPLFSVPERMHFLREACGHLDNVQVDYFHGLTVEYVESLGAKVIIRGLRAMSDFEKEFQMALMNKTLNDSVETLFMITKAEHLFLSSSLVKEVVELGAPLEGLVPKSVEKHLLEKLRQREQEAKSK
ncbi:MAG: pantetheine-phosphate adenylyltransferase [Armatimonadetes bacterium]|nr:pantetheine-phosphate adenylyltransferase [Armatimonadota bacterium]